MCLIFLAMSALSPATASSHIWGLYLRIGGQFPQISTIEYVCICIQLHIRYLSISGMDSVAIKGEYWLVRKEIAIRSLRYSSKYQLPNISLYTNIQNLSILRMSRVAIKRESTVEEGEGKGDQKDKGGQADHT